MDFRREVFRATTFDKSAWGEGEWHDEPDVIRWRWRSFACLLLRSEVSGTWCGYVGVPATHRLFGVHYDTADERVFAHGGLTFAGEIHPEVWRPEHDEPRELWWFGFDTAHAFDRMPKMEADLRAAGVPSYVEQFRHVDPELGRRIMGIYRTADYVAGNVVLLAAQLARFPARSHASPRRLRKQLRRAERAARKKLIALAGRRTDTPFGFDMEPMVVRLACRRHEITAGALGRVLGLRRPPLRVPRRLRRYLIEAEAPCELPEPANSAERPEPWSSPSPKSN